MVIAEKITPASTRRFRKEADSVMVPALEVIRKSERTSSPVGFARTRAPSQHTRKIADRTFALLWCSASPCFDSARARRLLLRGVKRGSDIMRKSLRRVLDRLRANGTFWKRAPGRSVVRG